MKCQKCDVEIQGRKEKKYCSDKCRLAAWADAHIIKRKHPKRIRIRERERLYVIIHKGESIEYLRYQAREASRVQALREREDYAMTKLYRIKLHKQLLTVANNPIVQSVLYDLDLLPEQLESQKEMTVRLFAAYNRLEGILLAFKIMEVRDYMAQSLRGEEDA